MSPIYRYTLKRHVAELGSTRGTLLWVMLNPSTADESTDDPTIRKCVSFTRRWGYSKLSVVNLYAMRATKPVDLMIAPNKDGSPMAAYTEEPHVYA